MNLVARVLRHAADMVLASPFFTKDCLANRPRTEVGEYTYGCPKVIDFGEGSHLKIGKFCSIAGGVVIMLGGNHRMDWITTYPFPALGDRWPLARGIVGHPGTKGDIVIGNDVWIAAEAIILSGVTVGDGAVIAARAVVTRDVPPYAVVAGNPAKVVKLRFDVEEIELLLNMRWWDWDESKISQNLEQLCSSNIRGFVACVATDPNSCKEDTQCLDAAQNNHVDE